MRARAGDVGGGNPALRQIAVAWCAVNLAEWAFVTALTIAAYRAHGALAVGVLGARFASGAVFGSVLLDILPRRRPLLTMRLTCLVRALIVALAALIIDAHGPLVALAAVVWLDAAVAAPYRPMQSSVLPALASTPRDLSAMASSIPVVKALAQAVGALLGASAITETGADVVALGAAAVFVLTAALSGPLRRAGTGLMVIPSAFADDSPRHRFGAVGTGFELLARRARPLLVLGGARSLTRGLWTALAVVASLSLLRLGSAGVGLLMAAGGVGAASAVPLALRFAGRRHLAVPAAVAFALAGLPIAIVGLLASPAAAVVLVVIWGCAFAMADSIANALIHRVVEARLLTPSVAAVESSKLLLEGLGALAAPLLLSLLGVRDALIVAGVPLPVVALLARRGLARVDQRAEQRARPLAILRRTPSLHGLTMLALEDLTSRLDRCEAGAGEVIIRRGESGDRLYLIDTGRVGVTINGYAVAEVGPGGSFGEKALLRAVPRSATVTALAPTELWFLGAADFIAAVTGAEGRIARPERAAGGRSLQAMLAGVPLFGAIDRRSLASRGTVREVSPGEVLVRQGDAGDTFFVLLEGDAAVSVDGAVVQTLNAGDWFGEIALLHRVERSASVRALGPLRVWALDAEAFVSELVSAGAGERSGVPREATALVAAGLIV